MNEKCHNCLIKPINHRFKVCISSTCSCPCVSQIYQMGENLQEEDIRIIHPQFLKINNGEDKEIPSVDIEIAKFVRVKKSEWLPKKKDKRFRKVR